MSSEEGRINFTHLTLIYYGCTVQDTRRVVIRHHVCGFFNSYYCYYSLKLLQVKKFLLIITWANNTHNSPCVAIHRHKYKAKLLRKYTTACYWKIIVCIHYLLWSAQRDARDYYCSRRVSCRSVILYSAIIIKSFEFWI